MRKLTLHKPALDDYVDVEKDLNENYRKIEEWANSSGTELDNKFDDGGVSTDYDTAKKMEDKIKFLATQIEKTPIGTILPFAGGTIPKDYLLCDGREITKNDYSELYDILPFGGYIDEKVFRGLAKNEVPNMTGPTLNGYTITESSVFSATFPGWKAFDSIISGDNRGWASLTGQKEGWVQIQYPNKRALSSFTIKTRTYAPGSKLEKISVYGVTTTSEDELFTENLSRAFTTNEKREFKVNFNKKTYDKFKIKVSAPNDQYCAIDDIELFTVDITQFPNHKQETTKKYLPDLRGQFLRGIKDGRKLLDWESEDIKKHNHKVPLAYPPESSVTNTLKEYTEVREKKTIFQTLMLDDNVNDNVYGRPIAKETYEGNETRPSNIGVNYIIKAKNGINDNSIPAYIESLLNDLNNLKNNIGANIKDNSISSSKLKTDSDADKIKLANLAEEVINSMSKLTKDSVVREYIANNAIDRTKLDDSVFYKSYSIDKKVPNQSLHILLETNNTFTNEDLSISFLADREDLEVAPEWVSQSSIIKNITKVNRFFKYIVEVKNLSTKIGFVIIKPKTGDFKGELWNLQIYKSNSSLPFSFKDSSGIIIKSYNGYSVDMELLLKEVYGREIGLKDFSNNEQLELLGKIGDEYEEIINGVSSAGALENAVPIFSKIFKAGKYKVNYVIKNFNLRVFTFDSCFGGEVLEKFDLTGDNNTFILKDDRYIGFLEVKDSSFTEKKKNISLNMTNDKLYDMYLFNADKLLEVGDIVSEKYNYGNGTILATTPFAFYYCPIYALSAKSISKIYDKDNEKIHNLIQKTSYRDIQFSPLEVVFEGDIDSLIKDYRISATNLTSNTMNGFSALNYNHDTMIESWKYTSKFVLNSQSTFGITTNNAMWAGSVLIDTENKKIIFGREISVNGIMTLEEKVIEDDYYMTAKDDSVADRYETRNIEGIDFVIGHTYYLVLERKGLISIASIHDYNSGKYFEVKTYARFHGGISFLVQKGEVEIKNIEYKVALYNGGKAALWGDSLTEGNAMGTMEYEYNYAALLRKNYFNGSAIICGNGTGGTGDMLKAIKDLHYYNTHLDFHFVMLGTNQTSSQAGIDIWKQQIVEIYNIILSLGAKPIIIVPPLRTDKVATVALLQMRDFILEKGWDTIRMDIAVSLNGEGQEIDPSLTTDGIHFNIQGNQKMYERALIDLKKIM